MMLSSGATLTLHNAPHSPYGLIHDKESGFLIKTKNEKSNKFKKGPGAYTNFYKALKEATDYCRLGHESLVKMIETELKHRNLLD